MADISKVKYKNQTARRFYTPGVRWATGMLPAQFTESGTVRPAPIYFGPDFPYHVRCQQTRAWTEFAL